MLAGVPLEVRLQTSLGDKHFTKRLRNLKFRKAIPGGMVSASLEFDQSLLVTDPAVALYGKCYIYDGRNGNTVWEGRQEDPGRSAGPDGQVWSLDCYGPAVHVEDDNLTVCYVENALESWSRTATFGLKTGEVATSEDEPPQLQLAFSNGTVVTGTGTPLDALSRLLYDCGQNMARWKVVWAAGITDANADIALVTHATPTGAGTVILNATLNVAGGTLAAVITTNIAVGQQVADLRLRSSTARTIADETHWIAVTMVLQGTRYTAAGTEQTTAATYANDTVVAADVVNDLLGRILTQFDGANASVATTATYAIDRLVYPDPVTPGQILDDLMALNTDHFWVAGASTSAGKYSFTWQKWPTSIRYKARLADTFFSPGNVGDLYNRVRVRWQDNKGRPRSTVRTLAQADLTAAGITRTAILDLGDNVGSPANAAQAGDRFLLDHSAPPNAGTLTVKTPIYDTVLGKMVRPWEIEPGNLIAVDGVLPRVDALNATDRDGVTVFRIYSVEYDAASNAATLELDSLGRGAAQQIAEAHKKFDRRRRR